MKQFCKEITVSTKSPMEFVDITDRVRDVLAGSGIGEGLATVFSTHTTCAVKINERCARLQNDMEDWLKRTVPHAEYSHDVDTVDDRPNGRGHLMSMLLNASETIPVSGGKLALGGWQSVFFVELDGPRTQRTVTVKIVGE